MNEYRQKLLKRVGLDISNVNSLKYLWPKISSHSKINESFIREFVDELDWATICSTRRLTDNFLLEFEERINWDIYLQNFPVCFAILKKYIMKTPIQKLEQVVTCYLSDVEKKEIQRLLDFKYLFKKIINYLNRYLKILK